MRWQEEVTLNGYEMEWTVRYFLHMSCKWEIPSGNEDINYIGTGTGTGTSSWTRNDIGMHPTPSLSAGAIAYRTRKHAVWRDLMKKADAIFRRSNPAYQSPL
jgi:hypothetical protein